MELVPWRPFGTLGSTRKELDSLLNRFFRETPSMGMFTEEWLPFVDISETKKNFIVKAELPGLDAKDVNVSLSGSFQRSFQLPTSVKGDKVEAIL